MRGLGGLRQDGVVIEAGVLSVMAAKCFMRWQLGSGRWRQTVWVTTAGGHAATNCTVPGVSDPAQKNGIWSANVRVGCGFMAGKVPIRVTCFIVLAACGAMCQRDEKKWNSLPDAPSERMTRAFVDQSFVDQSFVDQSPVVREPVMAAGAGSTWQNRPAANVVFAAIYKDQLVQKEPGDLFSKYLYPAMTERNLSYRGWNGESIMGRATLAASQTFMMRDASGKAKVNTSYFLRVLSSALVHTAYRPYWRRSVGTPFSDFGATIGNDAGMNLWHEFRPGLEQMVKGHTPKFVDKIEASLGRR